MSGTEQTMPPTPGDQVHTTAVDWSAADFVRHGHAVIDRLARHFESLTDPEGPPVFPARNPVELAPLFSGPPPEAGVSMETLLDDWDQLIVPNSTLQGHPRFFSWVNGGGTQVGALADALASGLNANPGGWRAAQAATVIERQTIEWLAALMGLAPSTGGLFVSGGTMANTVALRVALCETATWDIKADGLLSPGRPARLTVYMADHEAHISLTKALGILGLGSNALRPVPSNDDFTINIGALDQMLADDIASGMTPFCLVAHGGSINAGAIDDIDAMADIAERHGIWLHVDGAIGALGAILPELRQVFRGIERADSVSFDAHKWMGVPYEVGCLLLRVPGKLRSTFGIEASYLNEAGEEEPDSYNYYDQGPQMSRGWRALKVWMSLRHYGARGYREFFRRTIDCARHAHQLVSAADDFEVLQHEPQLYIYSFRYRPAGEWSDEQLDAVNAFIADDLKRRGFALVMTTRIHGRVTQRLSIANHRTTREHITRTLEEMRRAGRRFMESNGSRARTF